jgi:tripartite-type tricarboxylate transporter receptor subunit TctC
MRSTQRAADRTLLAVPIILAVSSAGLLFFTLVAQAADGKATTQPYYQGKRVSLLIGTSPGSSADILGRIIIQGLSKYVAGKPTIIGQNMPGSGSVTMMNYLYNVAPRDGTAMGIVVGGIYMRHLLDSKGIKHDLSKMIPIYNPEGGGAIIYAGKSLGLHQPKDIINVKREVTFGFSNPEGNSAMLGQAGFTMLGVRYRGISGYKGSHDVALAVERGELDTGWNTPGAYQLSIKPQVDAGNIVPIFQSGLWRPKDNTIVPDPNVPDVPTFDALYRQVKGTDPSGPLWDAWFMPLISYARYTIFFPPGVPKEAVDAMTAGLEKVCADSAYQDHVRKIELDPKCYLKEEARAITERSSKAPAEAVNALKALLKR